MYLSASVAQGFQLEPCSTLNLVAWDCRDDCVLKVDIRGSTTDHGNQEGEVNRKRNTCDEGACGMPSCLVSSPDVSTRGGKHSKVDIVCSRVYNRCFVDIFRLINLG